MPSRNKINSLAFWEDARWRHTGHSALVSYRCLYTGVMYVYLHWRHGAGVSTPASCRCHWIGVILLSALASCRCLSLASCRCFCTRVMLVFLHWRHVGVSTLESCRYLCNTFNVIMSTSLMPCNILHSTAYTTTLSSTASSKMSTANTSCNSSCHCVNWCQLNISSVSKLGMSWPLLNIPDNILFQVIFIRFQQRFRGKCHKPFAEFLHFENFCRMKFKI